MVALVEPRALNVEQFLAQYGDDNGYEMIDGEAINFPTFPVLMLTADQVLGNS